MAPLRSLPFLLLATPVAAHPGHLAEVAGHGHWIALGALGAAAAIAAAAALKARAKDKAAAGEAAESDEEAEDLDPQEA